MYCELTNCGLVCRSKWTFGVQPPGIDSFILTRDTSSPQCYQANSFVAVSHLVHFSRQVTTLESPLLVSRHF